MTDWTLFSFLRAHECDDAPFILSSPNYYFSCFIPLNLRREFRLCYTNCRLSGICRISREGRGIAHAEFELQLDLSVRFCVLCAARRVWSLWKSSCWRILPKFQSSRSHLLKIHPQPQRPSTSKKRRHPCIPLSSLYRPGRCGRGYEVTSFGKIKSEPFFWPEKLSQMLFYHVRLLFVLTEKNLQQQQQHRKCQWTGQCESQLNLPVSAPQTSCVL